VQPRFNPDDQVYASMPDGTKKVGTVVEVNKLGNKWRYVVQFFDGEDVAVGVFIDSDLDGYGTHS